MNCSKTILCGFVLGLFLLPVSCKKDDNPGKVKYGIDGITPLPDAVDLGIGVKWASYNLGASKEYEYGDFYAWGETETKTDYSWSTYKYANGDKYKLTKYCTVNSRWDGEERDPDGYSILLPTDDVAHVKLGGSWRIPTEDEFKALLTLKDEAKNSSSDYVWEEPTYALDANGDEIKDKNGNVISGIRITRKSTGASLFLPFAGYYSGTNEAYGTIGMYWSSSVNTKYPERSCTLLAYPKETRLQDRDRPYGFSVRPVTK